MTIDQIEDDLKHKRWNREKLTIRNQTKKLIIIRDKNSILLKKERERER